MIRFNPLISIVVPSFNQGSYIEETLQSIISQDYKNKEIIVIDGKSNDQTVNILQKYNDHLTYWCSEPDKGQTDALIKGFNFAKGDIFYWLCSDDLLLPGVLKQIAHLFEINNNLDFIYGDTISIPRSVKNFKTKNKVSLPNNALGF